MPGAIQLSNCEYPCPQHIVIFQVLSRVQLFGTPWTAARWASLSFTISQSLLKLMSIESVIPSNRLILCHPLLLLRSVFPSIRVFSNELSVRIRWPKYFCDNYKVQCYKKPRSLNFLFILAVLSLHYCLSVSLVAVKVGVGASLYLQHMGFSLQWLLMLCSVGSRACGLQQLWCIGLVAPQHVGSSGPGIKPVSPALAGGVFTT